MPQDDILARNVVRVRKMAEVLVNSEIFKKEDFKRAIRLCGISSFLDHSERTSPCIILAFPFHQWPLPSSHTEKQN